tara:strand:- start:4332 stop:4535 length:204 start_codon:yes stop_codon:yes gene_type:complete
MELNALENIIFGVLFVIGLYAFYKVPVVLAHKSMNEDDKGNGTDTICGMIGVLIYIIILLYIDFNTK